MNNVRQNGSINVKDNTPFVMEKNGIELEYSSGEGEKRRPLQGFVLSSNSDKKAVSELLEIGNVQKYAFDKALGLAVQEYSERTGKEVGVKFAQLKGADRIIEKLKEADQMDGPSGILDVVRATVVLDSIEDVFEFVKFTRTFDLKNNCGLKKSLVITDDNYNGKVKILRPSDHIDIDVSQLINNGYLGVPILNVFSNNGFYLKDENQDNIVEGEGVKRLFNTKKSYKTNYSDVKFYTYIPIGKSEIENGRKKKQPYFLCETIVTVKRFDDVYEATHDILSEQRRIKDVLSDKNVVTLSEKEIRKYRNLNVSLDNLLFNIHIGVKELYNREHKNGLHFASVLDEKFGYSRSYVSFLLSGIEKDFSDVFFKVYDKLEKNNDLKLKNMLDDIFDCVFVDNVMENNNINEILLNAVYKIGKIM